MYLSVERKRSHLFQTHQKVLLKSTKIAKHSTSASDGTAVIIRVIHCVVVELSQLQV